ncbi:RES domain-containing protein [Paracoccus suum]|uniref:RES domain-containing protein n=1 Tax=Paracoccus suum TaxID=2259340 RepID=A0A344PJL2_9RHOB|nr:RES domain-containing protein [Paracoccus suum]AXC49567.1 RES domain-containing protein [Paracoccus suum]
MASLPETAGDAAARPPPPDPTIWQGTLYRALNPRWMREPLSGEGARRHGGRFNLKGRAALYTALDPMTAVAEASQVGQPLQPVTLVSYAAAVGPIFDATEPALLAKWAVSPADLAAPDWRLRMGAARPPAGTTAPEGGAPGQILAERLIAHGYAAMLVPSYARTAQPGARNMVLWDWDGRISVNDTEGRLA